MKHHLQVMFNDELTLYAGWWEEVEGPPRHRRVHPPSPTLFEQVLAYLERVADPLPGCSQRVKFGEEAIAATAVCLRWGSYLAVLLNHAKPISPETRDPETSRVSDGEMARINIEASAALAWWIDIMQADWPHYEALVRASQRLPMPQKRVPRDREYLHLLGLSRPQVAAALNLPLEGEIYEQVQAHPIRTLRSPSPLRSGDSHTAPKAVANALINACWRNGPIEDIHAGQTGTYPLSHRRVAFREEQTLMRATASRMIHGIYGFTWPPDRDDRRSWAERVLPYAHAQMLLVTPTGWSLTEKSREVCLPGGRE